MGQARCCKCGNVFESDRLAYCGNDFCPDCRGDPQDDVIAARKEAYQTYLNDGLGEDEADRKARDFVREVERERARRGK